MHLTLSKTLGDVFNINFDLEKGFFGSLWSLVTGESHHHLVTIILLGGGSCSHCSVSNYGVPDILIPSPSQKCSLCMITKCNWLTKAARVLKQRELHRLRGQLTENGTKVWILSLVMIIRQVTLTPLEAKEHSWIYFEIEWPTKEEHPKNKASLPSKRFVLQTHYVHIHIKCMHSHTVTGDQKTKQTP